MSRASSLDRRPSGFSLVELMIAILIGTILMAGVIQVFIASRTAYQLSQGIARNQENARFALDFLSRDLRMVGHMGCVNDKSLTRGSSGIITGGNIRSLFLSLDDRNANTVANAPYRLRFDVSVQGYEATGSGPAASVDLPTTYTVGAANDWSPALPSEISGLNPLKGSDIVVLRYLSEEQAPVNALNLLANPATIGYPSANSKVAVDGPGLYGLADCDSATIFQASTTPGTQQMTVTNTGFNKSLMSAVSSNDGSLSYKPGGAILYRAQIVVYYLKGSLQNPSVPALYRTSWKVAPAGTDWIPVTEEIVDGIDTLQLLYGEDDQSDLALPATGKITRMNTASTIGNETQAGRWRRVGAVQLGLLVRGGSERSGAARPDGGKVRVLGTTYTLPDDGQYRSTYETTIGFRNRLFGN